MGFFDSISSRNKDVSKAVAPCAKSSSDRGAETQRKKEINGDNQQADTTQSERFSTGHRPTYIPTAAIPNAQAFVTSDQPFNAGASNYAQSTMRKKQMMDAKTSEAQRQAAKDQAIAKNHMQAVQLKTQDGWPHLPVYLDIAGRDLKDPSYHAMLSHLGVTRGLMLLIDRDFNKNLDAEKVSRNKVERRHLDSAARKTCEGINDFLSREWEIFTSISFVWDASIDEVAFRFAYPSDKEARFKWNETVKGPHWDREDWHDWNEGKKQLGLL